jgi:preflagellin peptidase FlaK
MSYLEGIQLIILFSLLIIASISDIKYGYVKNRIIIISIAIGLGSIIPYFLFYVPNLFVTYLCNVGFSAMVGLAFYYLGIWGAGDSKLLFAIMILIPVRLYDAMHQGITTCFLVILLIFVAAFLFVIGDTLYLGIRQKNLFVRTTCQINWKSAIKCYLFIFSFLLLTQNAISIIFQSNGCYDRQLYMAIYIFVLLFGIVLAEKASWVVSVILVIIAIGFSIYSRVIIRPLSLRDNLKFYIASFLLILFRNSATKYNYDTIPISELKAGMILSLKSSLLFTNSKIVGLPSISKEDMRSRLTNDEIESISKWSKYNKNIKTVTIIRKIPFAVFLSIGTGLFILLEVLIK